MTSEKCMTRVKMEISVNYVQFFTYWNKEKSFHVLQNIFEIVQPVDF